MSPAFAFRVGDPVRVARRFPLGHVRTPAYIRGRTGVVTRHCGAFPAPELAALHRRDGPRIPLYRVCFRMAEIWPGPQSPRDTLEVEVFEDWLEPAP